MLCVAHIEIACFVPEKKSQKRAGLWHKHQLLDLQRGEEERQILLSLAVIGVSFKPII